MDKEDTKVLKLFDGIIGRAAEKFATNRVLAHSRYIFITGEGKNRKGYCTHCNSKYFIVGGRHNKKEFCPKCKKECTVKLAGYSRKHLYDYGSMLIFRKAKNNKNAIIGVYCEVSRNYSGDFTDVQTNIKERARYYFEVGNARMFSFSWYSECWKKQKTIWDYFRKHAHYGVHLDDIKSLNKAVKGTAFEHIHKCFIDNKRDDYSLEKLDLYCKYPSIEYVVKAGYKNLMNDYVYGHGTGRTINWRGKTIYNFLRISKGTYSKIRGLEMSYRKLSFIQKLEKTGDVYSRQQILSLTDTCVGWRENECFELLEYLSAEKFLKYIEKLMQEKEWCHSGMGFADRFSSPQRAFEEWMDYIGQCKKLRYDLSDDSIVRPKNLTKSHNRLSKLIKYQESKELDEKILKRSNELIKELYFEYDGLFIRPAQSSQEFINEGKALNHCVGGYAERHASGSCTILFVRKKEEPQKPYFTVEVRGNRIIQARGYKNMSQIKDSRVKMFLQMFSQTKLTERKKIAS